MSEEAKAGKRGSYRAGFFFGSLSFGATLLLGFASTVVTARLYGVEVVGDYALVFAPVSALWVLSTVKEQQALIREITRLEPRHPRITQMFAAVFTFSTALTLVVAAILALVCAIVFPGPLDRPQLLAPALVSIAGYVLVTNNGWNLDSVLSAFVAGRALFGVRVNEALGFIVLATVFGLIEKSVWGLVAAAIGSSAIALVHRVVAVRPFLRGRLTRAEYRTGLGYLPDLLSFGLRATPGQIAQGIGNQGGIWAIGIVAPAAAVGAYSRAMVIPKSVQQASMKITEVLFPTLVARRAEGDGHGFDRALIDSIRYEVIGMGLLAAALGGCAHLVLEIFGPGFDAAATALVLLLFFPVLAAVSITQTQALWAVDRPGLTSVISVVRMVVTVALLVALTPSMHYAGPPLALLAGMLVGIAISGWYLRSHLARPARATWPWRERAALVVAYAAGFGAAHGVEAAWHSLAALPLALAAGCLAFALVLVLVGGVNDRDRERLAPLWARLRLGRVASFASIFLALLLLPASGAGAYVYWSDGVGNGIGRAELTGVAAPGGGWLDAGGESCGVAVDAAHVYWTTRHGTIGRAGLDGSDADPEFIELPSGSACGVAVDAGHLYWASATSGKLGRAALDGGAAEPAWMSPGRGHGCGIAVDTGRVYWASASGVYSAPLAGGPVTTISAATADNCGVAVNAVHAYWATRAGPGGEGAIMRGLLGGGPPTAIAAAPQSPCGVAIDSRYVYWANAGSNAISRAGLDGSGLVKRFATGAAGPCGVAVDGFGAAAAPPSAARPSNLFRLGRVSKNRKRGTARLEVLVPGPGTLVLVGHKVRERRLARRAGAGAVEIPVKPRHATRELLREFGLAVAPLSVTYTPTGGVPRTRYTRVWLRLDR